MKLGDVLQLAKGNLIDIQDNEEYVIAGVQNSGAGVVNRRIVKGKELTMKKYQLIEENQLMWCKVDTKGGAFGVTQKEQIGSLASTNMALAYIDQEKCLPEFIANLFRFKPFHENITKYSSGSTNRKYLTPSQLFEFIEIPTLTIDEQRQWIAKLDFVQNSQLFREIDFQLELVRQLRQAFLREAMQGKLVPQDTADEPAEILLGKIKAEKEKLIAEKKIKKDKPLPEIKPEEIPFEIPNNWIWCRLGELCFVTKLAGFEYTNYFNLKPSGEIPVIRAQNVKPNRMLEENLLYIEKEISLKLERSALTKKCLLITFIGAGIGEVAIFDKKERWHLASNVAKAEPLFESISAEYLMWLLLSDFGMSEFIESYQKQPLNRVYQWEQLGKYQFHYRR